MPSTRSSKDPLMDGLPNDYSDDPDYREESEDEEADELPKTMQRDRAQWIEDNVEDIQFLYRHLLTDGRSVIGNAFLQTCTINAFANFLYRHTTPFSES